MNKLTVVPHIHRPTDQGVAKRLHKFRKEMFEASSAYSDVWVGGEWDEWEEDVFKTGCKCRGPWPHPEPEFYLTSAFARIFFNFVFAGWLVVLADALAHMALCICPRISRPCPRCRALAPT